MLLDMSGLMQFTSNGPLSQEECVLPNERRQERKQYGSQEEQGEFPE